MTQHSFTDLFLYKKKFNHSKSTERDTYQEKSFILFKSILLLTIILGILTLLGVLSLEIFGIEHLIDDLNSYPFLLSAIGACSILLIFSNKQNLETTKIIALFFPLVLICIQFIFEKSDGSQIGDIVIYSILSRIRFIMFALLFLIAVSKPNYFSFLLVAFLNTLLLLFFEELHSILSNHKFPESALGVLNYPEVRLTFAGAYGVLALGILKLHEINFNFSIRLSQLIDLQKSKNFQLKEQKEEIDNINESLRFKQMTLEGSISTLNQQNMRIQKSMNYASRIQKTLLPTIHELNNPLVNSALLYLPKDIVSGDFYWNYQRSAKHLWYCVADCTGHGIPGAFMSVLGMQLLDKIVKDEGIEKPDEILNRLNFELRKSLNLQNEREIRDGMDITICYIDYTKSEISIASAKQSAVWVHNNNCERLKGDNLYIGHIASNHFRVNTYRIPINVHDTQRLILYSDGYQDQFGENDKKYGSKNFRLRILETSHLSVHDQIQTLKDDFKRWKGIQKQTDDVTVLVLQF